MRTKVFSSYESQFEQGMVEVIGARGKRNTFMRMEICKWYNSSG